VAPIKPHGIMGIISGEVPGDCEMNYIKSTFINVGRDQLDFHVIRIT
jgi:hypothetical protein